MKKIGYFIFALILLSLCLFGSSCQNDPEDAGENIYHVHEEMIVLEIPPTCSTVGYTAGSMCTVCRKYIVRPNVISMLDHTPVTDQGRPGNCTEKGMTEGSHCGVCGKTIVAQTETDFLHSPKIIPDVIPTCTEDGKTAGKQCSDCGIILEAQKTLPKGHTATGDQAVSPTCSLPGKEEGRHCAACGEIIKEQKEIPATDMHVFVDGKCVECQILWKPSENIIYELVFGSYYKVVDYTAVKEKYVIIPDTYKGLPVKEIDTKPIGEKRFAFLELPQSVTLAGRAIFEDFARIRVSENNTHYSVIGDAFVNSDGVLLYWMGKDKNAVIPSDGKIYEIGESAFEGNNYIESVSLGSTVSVIRKNAFKDCKNLTTFYMPDNVIHIEESLFEGCISLENVRLSESIVTLPEGAFKGCSSLRSLNLPQSIRGIESECFFLCVHLEKLTFPDNIYSIGYSAFSGVALKVLNIPEGLAEIKSDTLLGMMNTVQIHIPKSVTKIEEGAMASCISLRTVSVDLENPNYYSPDGNMLIEKSTKTLIYMNAESEKITIPESVDIERIGANLFAGNGNIRQIIIPNTIKRLGDYAFKGLKIQSIVLPDSISEIGKGVFSECDNLKHVRIPADVRVIAADTFKGCDSLESVTLPSGLTKIGECAFERCIALTRINIPDEVVSIGRRAFAYCTGLTSFRFPNKLTAIEEGLLTGTSISEVRIPSGITLIGKEAFKSCLLLKDAVIGENVKYVGDYAFGNCLALDRIVIGKNVSHIGSFALEGRGNATNIEIADDHEYFTLHASCLIEKRSGTLIICKEKGSQVVLPSDGSIYFIENYAFANLTNLKNLILPDTLSSIGDYAFSGCSGLNTLYIPETVVRIGVGAFEKCENLTALVMEDYVNTLGNGAFAGCKSLKNLRLSKSISAIGEGTFKNCTSLIEVNLPENTFRIFDSAFEGCTSIRTVSLPNNLLFIGEDFLKDCKNFRNINFSGTLSEWEEIEKSTSWITFEQAKNISVICTDGIWKIISENSD